MSCLASNERNQKNKKDSTTPPYHLSHPIYKPYQSQIHTREFDLTHLQLKNTDMGKHSSKLAAHNSYSTSSRKLSFNTNNDKTMLKGALTKLFDWQTTMEQNQSKYQNSNIHKDVDVISAASNQGPPTELNGLWRVPGSMTVEPVTHGLLEELWTAATKETVGLGYDKALTMDIEKFKMIITQFMYESREQCIRSMHEYLKLCTNGMRNVLETSLSREERKDEYAKANAERLHHELKQTGVWLQWQEETLKKYIKATFQLFDDNIVQLVIGILTFFDKQREKLLREKNNVWLCIASKNKKKKKNEGPIFAMASFDKSIGRPIVTYANPDRVPRVESLELLLAKVGIQNITLSNSKEVKYYEKIKGENLKRKSHHHDMTPTRSWSASLFSAFTSSGDLTEESKQAATDDHHPGKRDTSGERVVHVEEFCRWFLPAAHEVLTAQNLINESGRSHPDILSLFPPDMISGIRPFSDEPDPAWYTNLPSGNVHVELPVGESESDRTRAGTVQSLKSDGNFLYIYDKHGDTIADTNMHTLTKWQLVEYGAFDFTTINTSDHVALKKNVKAQSTLNLCHAGSSALPQARMKRSITEETDDSVFSAVQKSEQKEEAMPTERSDEIATKHTRNRSTSAYM